MLCISVLGLVALVVTTLKSGEWLSVLFTLGMRSPHKNSFRNNALFLFSFCDK